MFKRFEKQLRHLGATGALLWIGIIGRAVMGFELTIILFLSAMIASIVLEDANKEANMCVPTVAIREDGKGFMVQRGGVWWDLFNAPGEVWSWWYAFRSDAQDEDPGVGETILEAVDSALAKLHKDEGAE